MATKQRRIRVTLGGVQVTATLNGCRTADLLWDALPITGSAGTWGDEIYFRTPVSMTEDDATETFPMGAVAYWPPGQALCLFFGRTPASRGDEIRMASPGNLLGAIEGDPKVLKRIPSGAAVTVERA
jgi:hypothetical protein